MFVIRYFQRRKALRHIDKVLAQQNTCQMCGGPAVHCECYNVEAS